MKYNCPLCQAGLVEIPGEAMHPNDPNYGVTLSCPNPDCPAQEVMGHGGNAKEAWVVIQQKFVKREERD